MLSRSHSTSMPSFTRPPVWDIFCNVIDNYGDIGVCWRLARQLANEHGLAVRLWVDDLTAFQRICPDIDPQLPSQSTHAVEVHQWKTDFPSVFPGDVVIEAFACHLPEPFIEAMAARDPKPVWINLDYLSAESWVTGCHALPSPHPHLPLTKYFFFPGFNKKTGGLLREKELEGRRQVFNASSAEQCSDFWKTLGLRPPPIEALTISLFAYENPAIPELLDIWSKGETSICCLAPATRSLRNIETFVGKPLQAGDVVQNGHLEIRVLPFVAQTDYDHLLWACDINFVRGEDSFVRAQWAEKPMVWHIYPQEENAHRVKLDAFLDLYCADLSEAPAEAVRGLYLAWNGGQITKDLWRQWISALPELRSNATKWANHLKKQDDLCSSLVHFCRSKL